MSEATQNKFKHSVCSCFQLHKNAVSLSNPTFKQDGYITTAVMTGSQGQVELRCGPAEYHVEIFIYSDEKRWTLADLVGIEDVRIWLQNNRPSTAGRALLDAEVESAFCLLSDGLKSVSPFSWLHS